MREKELILAIKQLKTIKPNQKWVVFAKSRIFEGKEKTAVFSIKRLMKDKVSAILDIFPSTVFGHGYNRHSLAYSLASFMFLLLMVSSTFIYAQNAMPGDMLFSLKKFSEKGRTLLATKAQLPGVQLEVANKRLEELTTIAQNKQGQKLAFAIKEFQASAKQAAQDIIGAKGKSNKEIVLQARKLEQARAKVEAMGVVIGDTEELDNALSDIITIEIKDLEIRILTEEQKIQLEEVKKAYESKDYGLALEKLLSLTQD